jgi:MATE family multidrug resistance protein
MLIGMAALSYPQPLLDWTEVPVDMQDEVKQYLWIVALGLPASLLFRMFGTLNQSLGKPKLVTWVQVVALMVKIPLSIVLTLGIDGLLPAMGLVGCAWATFIVNYIMLGLALWLIRTQDFYDPYALWKRIEPPDWPVLKRFVRLGLPSGLTIGVEVTSFTLMSLFIARLGVTATASHQIVSNLAAVMYMVPLSLSIASSARVSYWIGANNSKQARLALRTGLSLVLCMCVALASSLWLGREWVAAFYTQSAEVAQLTVALLAWITLYHLTDAVQVFCVFTLRSYGITVLPLITYTVLLWGVGLAGGYAVAYLGFGAEHVPWLVPQSPIAFWQSSSFALSITSMVLLSVLWRAAYRPTKAVG